LFHSQALCFKRSYTQVVSLVMHTNLIYSLILSFLEMHGSKAKVMIISKIIFVEYLKVVS